MGESAICSNRVENHIDVKSVSTPTTPLRVDFVGICGQRIFCLKLSQGLGWEHFACAYTEVNLAIRSISMGITSK